MEQNLLLSTSKDISVGEVCFLFQCGMKRVRKIPGVNRHVHECDFEGEDIKLLIHSNEFGISPLKLPTLVTRT